MAAASGGLIFVNGLGAILGPILTGWAISIVGSAGFWAYLAITFAALTVYVMYRMTQRPSAYREEEDYDAVTYAPVLPTATPVALEAAQEFYAENADTDEEVPASGGL